MYKAEVIGVVLESALEKPVMLLKTDNGNHTVSILVGPLEAASIASSLKNIKFDRPLTHDLLNSFIRLFDASVQKVSIYDVKDDIFFANIYISRGDDVFEIDARPSDAIALALKFDASIFIDECVIEKIKLSVPTATGEIFDNSPKGKKWAEYLESLPIENFGKYKV